MGREGKKKRGGVWRTIFIVSLIVVIGALGVVGYIFYGYWAGQDQYDKLEEHVTIRDDNEAYTLASFQVDWAALRAINPDVVGWVYLPDSPINYPIVRREGNDSYYMKHNFDGSVPNGWSPEYGVPTLANVNSPYWTDQISYVAGHHMLNGMLFSFLDNMIDNEGFNSHRTFYVLTPQGNFKTTAFAADMIKGWRKDIVLPNFETREEFDQYLQARVNDSEVTPNPPSPPVTEMEQVIAFYTCNEPDNSYRIIVYCNVDEFLPAGSDVTQGNALVPAQDVANANAAAQGRIG